MNGLLPWIKADVECWEPMGLAHMMKLAQRVENRELRRLDAGLGTKSSGWLQFFEKKESIPMAVQKDGEE